MCDFYLYKLPPSHSISRRTCIFLLLSLQVRNHGYIQTLLCHHSCIFYVDRICAHQQECQGLGSLCLKSNATIDEAKLKIVFAALHLPSAGCYKINQSRPQGAFSWLWRRALKLKIFIYMGSQRLNCVFTNKTKLKNRIIYNTTILKTYKIHAYNI